MAHLLPVQVQVSIAIDARQVREGVGVRPAVLRLEDRAEASHRGKGVGRFDFAATVDGITLSAIPRKRPGVLAIQVGVSRLAPSMGAP